MKETTKICCSCTWIVFWLVLNIYWPIHYANHHNNSQSLPKNSTVRIPPTLSYKTLVITRDSLTYDGDEINDTLIYFLQAKYPAEKYAYWIW